jgi:DNA-binding transcriptional regulator YhcF (GntR family)
MPKAITDIIQIDPTLAVPVYKQIVQSVIRNIESGTLTKDDTLPSVNKIAEVFSLARGSVFTAYNDLRASGIIDSVPGKGYYISSTETRQNKRILVLLNSFAFCKEALYQSLMNNLPKTYTVDVFFYDNDMRLFENRIRQHAGYYNLFVVMPLSNENTPGVLTQFDSKSILLLETGFKEYRKDFAGVYQNFEKDIQSILQSCHKMLAKYNRLMLVAPNHASLKDIVSGFNKFSKKTAIAASVRTTIDTRDIQSGDAFIVTDDDDLVTIVKHCTAQKWKLGKDIGVISYNESNLKSIIADGITTFSIDYESMGKAVAEMITTRKREAIENNYILIDRKSF